MGLTLTTEEQTFVRVYLETRSARQAAIASGSGEANATRYGKKMLADRYVAEAIQKAQEIRDLRTGIDATHVVRETARIAFADPRKLFDEEGNLLSPHQWPDDVAHAVSAVGYSAKGQMVVKLAPKTAALDMLMKHLGLFERDNSQRPKLDDAVAELMAFILKRKEEDRLPVTIEAEDAVETTPALPVRD